MTPSTSGKDCVLAWEVMPHGFQGNLTRQQAGWLDDHMAGCDACREQYAYEQRLQRAMSRPAGVPMDEEAGLQRLLARIDGPGVPKDWTSWRPAGWAERALVAAVLLQAIGLGVMGSMLWSMDPSPAYRTFSREDAPMPPGSIRLVPDPRIEVADWNELLQVHGLRVVAGPNEAGAYTVAPLSDAARRDALVRRLRATDGIRLAEPVASPP